MAKKIAEVPIPKENFLHGYKPITPKFAEDDEEDVKEDTPAEEKPVEQKPYEKKSHSKTIIRRRGISRDLLRPSALGREILQNRCVSGAF